MRPATRSSASTTRRWTRWQASALARRYLARAAAAQDYTLLKVPAESRAAFFAVVDLLYAHARLPQDATAHLEERQAAWHAWQTWTRRLAVYLDGVAAGHTDPPPTVPAALVALAERQEAADA
jgi:hypothetical protein